MFYFIYTYRKDLSTKRKKNSQPTNQEKTDSETLELKVSYAVFRQKVHPFHICILKWIYKTSLPLFSIQIKNAHLVLSYTENST